MVKSDAWRKRPAVLQYWAFKDECLRLGLTLPEGAFHIHFIIPMPDSWSKKKRAEHLGRPHQQKPDCDNLVKAAGDVAFSDDAHIADFRASKWWGEAGAIIVEKIEAATFPSLTLTKN